MEEHLLDCAECSALLATVAESPAMQGVTQSLRNAVGVDVECQTPYPDQTMANYRLPIHPDYRVRRLLPSASAGDLYLADRRSDLVPVVLQVVAGDASLEQRLKSLIEQMAPVANRAILRPLAVESIPDRLVIVQDYSAGVNLREWICSQGRVPWRVALDYAIQMARLLHEAHGAGVMHGTLAPEDALLHEGQIALRGWHRRLRSTITVPDPAQDVADLGRTLLAMLVGRGHLPANEPAPLNRLWPDCPARLHTLLPQMLAPATKADWPAIIRELDACHHAPSRRPWWRRWWPFAS